MHIKATLNASPSSANFAAAKVVFLALTIANDFISKDRYDIKLYKIIE